MMLRRADQLGFPVLEIPHEVAFDDILSQVLTDIANRETSNLIRAEQAHRAFMQIVLEGGGLTEITGELAKLLGASIAAIGGDGRVLAESGPGKVVERLAAGGFTGADGRLRGDQGVTSGAFQVEGTHIAVAPIVAGTLHYVDVLPAVNGGDSSSAAHAALRWVPASPAAASVSAGLTPPPQAFSLSARPAARMLIAALISRSCRAPQAAHVQARTPSGFGPSFTPHCEQVCDVGTNRPIWWNVRPWCSAFTASRRSSRDHPASCTDLASRVRASAETARSSA
jgi:hypothetical protein